MSRTESSNLYAQLLEKVFFKHYREGDVTVTCRRDEFADVARTLGVRLPKKLYVGLDRHGAHYALTVQAKGGRDKIGVVQIEQDFALCEAKYPGLIPRPLAAQFMADDVIALFEFTRASDGIRVAAEKHYHLVRREDLSMEELREYQRRSG